MSRGAVRRTRRGKPDVLGRGVLRRQLHRERPTAFLAPAIQYFPSPTGGHACAESMLADSTFVARSVGRLAHLAASPRHGIFRKRTPILPRFPIHVNGLREASAGFVDFSTMPSYVRGPTDSSQFSTSHEPRREGSLGPHHSGRSTGTGGTNVSHLARALHSNQRLERCTDRSRT